MTPPNPWWGDCCWCFLGRVHLALQEKWGAASGTGSISTGWFIKNITTLVKYQSQPVCKTCSKLMFKSINYKHNQNTILVRQLLASKVTNSTRTKSQKWLVHAVECWCTVNVSSNEETVQNLMNLMHIIKQVSIITVNIQNLSEHIYSCTLCTIYKIK